MELARLTSNKQQASNKQASSAGPFLVHRAERVPKSKKNVTTLSKMVFHNCLGNNFFLVGPPPVGNGDLVGFWPILGRGHLEKFRAWAKNRKTQFPGARGPETEQKITTPSGMVVRKFLAVYVLTDRTPTGGKTRNTRILGHFGLGRPLAYG